MPVFVIDDNELLQKLVTTLEVSYYAEGIYPPLATLMEKWNVSAERIKKLIPKANSGLKTRGLPGYADFTALKENEIEVDPFFAIAVNLLVDTTDKRSKIIKLKAVGLTPARFYALLEDPTHRAYYNTRVNKIFNDTEFAAKLALAKNVEAGDLQSIKYFHEMRGVYDPNREIKMNMAKIINVLMEILVRHVNRDVIEAVGREFDMAVFELEN